MNKKWIAVNLVLLLAAGGLGWQLRVSVRRFWEANDVSRLQPRDTKGRGAEDGLPPIPAPRRYAVPDFASVPAQNLFSETRSKDEKVEAPAVPETPPLVAKPLLVGITISGNQRLAAIVDPQANQPAGSARKSQTKRVGDSYMGYTITDISDSAIVLEGGNRREVIPLFDTAKRPQGGGKTAIQATRVVPIGAGGAAGGSAPAVQASAAPTPVRSVVDGPRPPGQGAAASVTRSPQGITPTQAGAGRQVPGIAPTTPAVNESIDTQGRRVIRTPFGDIVRDRPPGP